MCMCVCMYPHVLNPYPPTHPTPTHTHRDMDNSKQFAIQSFAKQLLDVADNLSRALESVPADVLAEKKEENALLVTLVEGVRMTDQQLAKVFGANKIVKVRA